MATFDSLAGDQRAVLQLVLARRRGYEEIARMLSIAPDAVRGRALGALDALGPPTELAGDERQLICDYLLSQLAEGAQADARELLARSPAARAWAVGLTPALEPVSVDPLPRIPPAAPAASSDQAAVPEAPSGAVTQDAPAGERPPSSRLGGMIVIGLAAAVIIAAIVVLLVTHHHARTNGGLAADAQTTTTTPTTGTASTSTTSSAKAVAQINLDPVSTHSKAVGVAVVVRDGTTFAIELFGQHIPPNTSHNSYEVWLYSSPTHFEKLGFVSPTVGKRGTFSDAEVLPSNAAHYRQLLITTETAQKPTHPGPVLLHGTITGLS